MKKTETEPGWEEKSIFLEGEVDLRCAYMEGLRRSQIFKKKRMGSDSSEEVEHI